MMLTDREWLRFVSFGLVVGIVLGALWTGTLLLAGNTLLWAMAGTIIAGGLLALAVHLVLRKLLDRASDPTADSSTDDSDTEAHA